MINIRFLGNYLNIAIIQINLAAIEAKEDKIRRDGVALIQRKDKAGAVKGYETRAEQIT